ncbi:MAG: efflux RND transporter permease subunit [Calditrichia bacterium]
MAITVATAVFGSLILAFVFIPAISAIVFRNGVKVKRNIILDWLKPRYVKLLKWHIAHRKPVAWRRGRRVRSVDCADVFHRHGIFAGTRRRLDFG